MRLHQGTLRSKTAEAWVEFGISFFTAARQQRWRQRQKELGKVATIILNGIAPTLNQVDD